MSSGGKVKNVTVCLFFWEKTKGKKKETSGDVREQKSVILRDIATSKSSRESKVRVCSKKGTRTHARTQDCDVAAVDTTDPRLVY